MRWGALAAMAISFLVVTAALVLTAEADSHAKYWPKLCESCHDGKTALDAEQLRARYRTPEEFLDGVKTKGAGCMNIVKNDEGLIRKIAHEIGIRELQK